MRPRSKAVFMVGGRVLVLLQVHLAGESYRLPEEHPPDCLIPPGAERLAGGRQQRCFLREDRRTELTLFFRKSSHICRRVGELVYSSSKKYFPCSSLMAF